MSHPYAMKAPREEDGSGYYSSAAVPVVSQGLLEGDAPGLP